jgi:FkbH-like protein
MIRPALSEIQAFLKGNPGLELPSFPVSVLSNVTLSSLEPFLRYYGQQEQLGVSVRFGGFDTVLQDAAAARPDLFDPQTGAVFVLLTLETLSPPLATGFTGLAASEIEAELAAVETYVQSVLQGLRSQTQAPILWYGFETPAYPALGILDAQNESGQAGMVLALNRALRARLKDAGNAYFIDADACQRRLGTERYFDHRLWHLAKAPFTREALQEMALDIAACLRAIRGQARKCLVLDCDNTLWAGVAGEDGIEGIKLGGGYPGSCYVEFQRQALSLHRRGVILALASRNNEADVWEIFDKHPHMVLKREHISAWSIDWHDKAEGLRRLAGHLNIGLDSMVLADDSAFERGLVSEQLPMVRLLPVSVERPALNRGALASCGWFDTLSMTDEDKARGQLYRAETLRQEAKDQFASLEGYLRSLQMRLSIAPASEASVPRLSQLTQRTNQFNLTTVRYSEDDIRRLSLDPASLVLGLSLADRFGDLGLVGCAILRFEADCAMIESLMLSCRVLGRRVEQAFLADMARRAGERGLRRMVGLFRPSRKNAQVADFYASQGFKQAGASFGEQRFEAEISALNQSFPSVFLPE